jgi:hypothetical protein
MKGFMKFLKKERDGIEIFIVFALIIALVLMGAFDVLAGYGSRLLRGFRPIMDEYDI